MNDLTSVNLIEIDRLLTIVLEGKIENLIEAKQAKLAVEQLIVYKRNENIIFVDAQVTQINKLMSIMFEKDELIHEKDNLLKELMDENKGYRDGIDRLMRDYSETLNRFKN